MEDNANLKARSQLLRNIESAIKRYESEHKRPLSLANLNRLFGRQAREFGGVRLLAEEMEAQGLLTIIVTDSGGYDLSTFEKAPLQVVRVQS